MFYEQFIHREVLFLMKKVHFQYTEDVLCAGRFLSFVRSQIVVKV